MKVWKNHIIKESYIMSPYSARTRENADQKNSENGRFSHIDSVYPMYIWLARFLYV